MGQGSFVICEWDSVQKEFPSYQQAFMNIETAVLGKCNLDWAPKRFNLSNTYGSADAEYGRTTILPGAFDDHHAVPMATFRQLFNLATEFDTQITYQAGVGAGNVIPEGIKIALMGFAFPNKNQHITEIKMQIGDRKYGRFHLDEMRIMNKPALIFEEGIILDEEEAFDLYAYLEGPLPVHIGAGADAWSGVYQRVVPIGALYFDFYNKVGGNTGTSIPLT